MISSPRLLEVFVEVADTLVADYDIIDFLHRLADNISEVAGAEAVGLLLSDHLDQLQFMAASSDGARYLELFQLQNREGPCLDCFRTGVPVTVDDLSAAGGRWPVFAPKATRDGFNSVHAFPMRLRENVIGALNVFSTAPLPLEETDVRTIQALADVATIAIIQQQSLTAAETLTEQLQGALNSRVVVEQAKGLVSRSRDIGVDEAFDVMRTHSRNHGLRLSDVALALVNRELDPDVLGTRAERS